MTLKGWLLIALAGLLVSIALDVAINAAFDVYDRCKNTKCREEEDG